MAEELSISQKASTLCGPIHLKSNITIHLADDSIIKFSKDFDDYLPMVRIRWEGTELMTFSPLIYAYKQENLAIIGKGVLDGQGSNWWTHYKELKSEFNKNRTRNTKYQKEFLRLNNLTEIASETMDMSRIDTAFLRPPFAQPFDSKNILIESVTFKDSPFWNINPVYCENMTIKDVKIDSPFPSPNTDGIDVDSCKDVLISNLICHSGDDCIAIKSGRDLQGRRIGRPTENVLIHNCMMLRGKGGVAIGSEQSGGIRNVTVKDCVFNETSRGIFIKSTRGRGGVVENINFQNITMNAITKEAIHTIMNYFNNKYEPFSERTPVFRDIRYENIRANSNSSVVLLGIQESLLQNIEMKNIEINSESGLVSNFTTNLKLTKFSLKSLKKKY